MKKRKYKEIFTQIENTLRRESRLSKKLFDLRFGKFKNFNYKNMEDSDIFWIMVYVAFYSGMRASTVSQRLPSIRKYLFDFRKVKKYSEKEINQILSAPNTIHHKRKIEACVANAKEFDNLVSKHGSFGKYLNSFGSLALKANIDKLRKDLRRRFRYLGERTVNHFLTDLGTDVLKPDRVVCRIFSRLGLIDNKDNITAAIEVGRNFAAATNYPIRYIDIIFVTYGQIDDDEYFGLNGGICLERNPRCSICGVITHCKYCVNLK